MIPNCLVCRKEITRSNPHKASNLTYRSWRAVTCSRPCSRIYTRIAQYIRGTPAQRKISKLKLDTDVRRKK